MSRSQGPVDRLRIVSLDEAGERGPEHRVNILNPEDLTGFFRGATVLADQIITDGSPETISFGVAEYDIGDFFDIAQPTRLTAPFTGFYSVKGSCQFGNDPDGRRNLDIWSSRSPFAPVARVAVPAPATSLSELSVTCDLRVLAGDYVYLVGGIANVGQNLNSNFRFSIHLLGRD